MVPPRIGGCVRGVGEMPCSTAKRPCEQCGRHNHSKRATRCKNAGTDSITTGSGVGVFSAARADARCAALFAGPSKP